MSVFGLIGMSGVVAAVQPPAGMEAGVYTAHEEDRREGVLEQVAAHLGRDDQNQRGYNALAGVLARHKEQLSDHPLGSMANVSGDDALAYDLRDNSTAWFDSQVGLLLDLGMNGEDILEDIQDAETHMRAAPRVGSTAMSGDLTPRLAVTPKLSSKDSLGRSDLFPG